jgi:hypothetical protein
VEAGVGGAALGVRRGGVEPLEVLGQPLEVGARRPLGGERGRRAGDRGVVVGEVAEVVDAQLREAVEEACLGGLGGRVDERAAVAPAPRLDQPGRSQADERLAQRDGGDAELGGQLGLARQLVTVAEHADADRVREPPLDLGDTAAPVERREHRVARTRGNVARHGA